MGFFGTFLFDGTDWRPVGRDPVDLARADAAGTPYLWLDVYDSDIAELRYAPPGPGSGTAFLGFTPRTYFEDDTASPPTDTAREAAGLAHWATTVTGRPGPVRSEIEAWLAADGADDDIDFENPTEEAVFVEVRAAALLAVLGLPPPEDLG